MFRRKYRIFCCMCFRSVCASPSNAWKCLPLAWHVFNELRTQLSRCLPLACDLRMSEHGPQYCVSLCFLNVYATLFVFTVNCRNCGSVCVCGTASIYRVFQCSLSAEASLTSIYCALWTRRTRRDGRLERRTTTITTTTKTTKTRTRTRTSTRRRRRRGRTRTRVRTRTTVL